MNFAKKWKIWKKARKSNSAWCILTQIEQNIQQTLIPGEYILNIDLKIGGSFE